MRVDQLPRAGGLRGRFLATSLCRTALRCGVLVVVTVVGVVVSESDSESDSGWAPYSFWSKAACCARSLHAIRSCPHAHAEWSGVRPPRQTVRMLAPCANSLSTQLSRPWAAAACNGVRPAASL